MNLRRRPRPGFRSSGWKAPGSREGARARAAQSRALGTVCHVVRIVSNQHCVAVRVPKTVGVKVTLMVQLPLAATEPAQLLLIPNSPGFVPVNAMLLTVKLALPVLPFKVSVCDALVDPTFWLAKVRLDPARPASGPLPVPVRADRLGGCPWHC